MKNNSPKSNKPKKYKVEIRDEDGTWDTMTPVFDSVEAAKKAVMTFGEVNQKFMKSPAPFDYRIKEVGGEG